MKWDPICKKVTEDQEDSFSHTTLDSWWNKSNNSPTPMRPYTYTRTCTCSHDAHSTHGRVTLVRSTLPITFLPHVRPPVCMHALKLDV